MARTASSGKTTHVAVLLPEYVQAILVGKKTVESRLTLTRREPFGRVRAGDEIYFKNRGGPYGAWARVHAVEYFQDLTPARVRALRAQFNQHVQGRSDYWRAKAGAKYATFVWLTAVKATSTGPTIPPMNGRAWLSC